MSAVSKESIRQLVLDATAVDGAAPSAPRPSRGRRRNERFENHRLPTPGQLQAVKALGKRSQDNVRALYDTIMERMAFPSSHVRVCALELYEVLFARSSVFRRLGCDRLDILISRAVVGNLPSPPAYAEELQHRALGLIRRWNREFGSVQPKLGLVCRYLDGLGMFDEEGGEERQEGENTRSSADVPSPARSPAVELAVQEFRSSVAQWQVLVKELENARVVLESSNRACVDVQKRTSLELPAEDGEEWEEVGDDGDLTEDVYVPLLESYREATSETIPKLQGIISACREMYTSGFDAQVSNVLREAVELNASLVTACSTYERNLGDTVRKTQEQRRKKANNASDLPVQESKRRSTVEEERQIPSVNPMQLIRDPTMPRTRTNSPSDQHRKRNKTGTSDKGKQAILEKLAAVAPVVPVGGFAGVWDSHAPTTAVLGQTMEVANHWGPVDVTKELPKDRLDALFLIDQTKIKYSDNDGIRTEQPQHNDLGQQRNERKHQQQRRPVPGLASAQLTDRNEERRFNERVLRRAAMAAEFGFIRRDTDLGDTAGPSSPGSSRNKRKKLTVKASLTKKLNLK